MSRIQSRHAQPPSSSPSDDSIDAYTYSITFHIIDTWGATLQSLQKAGFLTAQSANEAARAWVNAQFGPQQAHDQEIYSNITRVRPCLSIFRTHEENIHASCFVTRSALRDGASGSTEAMSSPRSEPGSSQPSYSLPAPSDPDPSESSSVPFSQRSYQPSSSEPGSSQGQTNSPKGKQNRGRRS